MSSVEISPANSLFFLLKIRLHYFRRTWVTWLVEEGVDSPWYKVTRKFPFIPTEQELDVLIAGCGRKTATFLQLLKETAMRAGEAKSLLWTNIDLERRNITLNTPEKRGNPRIFKASNKLIDMLAALPKINEKVFPSTMSSLKQYSIIHGNYSPESFKAQGYYV